MFGASAVCAYEALLLIVGFFVECADAVPAYAFLLKSNQIPRCAAEQTGLLKLTDNNQIILQILVYGRGCRRRGIPMGVLSCSFFYRSSAFQSGSARSFFHISYPLALRIKS